MTSPISGTGAPMPLPEDPTTNAAPEVSSLNEPAPLFQPNPWRLYNSALVGAFVISAVTDGVRNDIGRAVGEVKDQVVSAFKALLTNPFNVRDERNRLLAELDPGIEIKTENGTELTTRATKDDGRFVKLHRPSNTTERPLGLTDFTVPGSEGGRIEVSLGVHDSRGPLGFRNADLVCQTLNEVGAIIDAAQASPLANEDGLRLPRLQLLEDELGDVAKEVQRLHTVVTNNPILDEIRTAYHAALNAKKAGDGEDTAFQAAAARVREALPDLGLSAEDEALVQDELKLCEEIRDKWVDWHASTGIRTLHWMP